MKRIKEELVFEDGKLVFRKPGETYKPQVFTEEAEKDELLEELVAAKDDDVETAEDSKELPLCDEFVELVYTGVHSTYKDFRNSLALLHEAAAKAAQVFEDDPRKERFEKLANLTKELAGSETMGCINWEAYGMLFDKEGKK